MQSSELHPRFGLEISGIDVVGADDPTVNFLRQSIVRYGFLVIRRQVLDDNDLVEFGRRIGSGRLEESARRVSHSPNNTLVSNLTNLRTETDTPLGFGGNDTDYWHSDQEFRLSPATLATLYCLIPPPVGGETSFACTVASQIGIPEALVARLRALRSTRIPAATHDNAEHIEVSHPAVLMNPVDGRESVYISENALRFPGLNEAASQALKKSVLEYVLAQENIYRHSWRMGDLVIYDNTQLLHRREAFSGPRWLKGTKIFAPPNWFAVPSGEVVEETVFAGNTGSQRARVTHF
jgi:taurine dioxygenase